MMTTDTILPTERAETRTIVPTSPEGKSIGKKTISADNLTQLFNQLTLRFGILNLITRITLSYNICSKYSYVVYTTRS